MITFALPTELSAGAWIDVLPGWLQVLADARAWLKRFDTERPERA